MVRAEVRLTNVVTLFLPPKGGWLSKFEHIGQYHVRCRGIWRGIMKWELSSLMQRVENLVFIHHWGGNGMKLFWNAGGLCSRLYDWLCSGSLTFMLCVMLLTCCQCWIFWSNVCIWNSHNLDFRRENCWKSSLNRRSNGRFELLVWDPSNFGGLMTSVKPYWPGVENEGRSAFPMKWCNDTTATIFSIGVLVAANSGGFLLSTWLSFVLR